MLKHRVFPRYNVNHYELSVRVGSIDRQDTTQVNIINTSLGGIKLHSSTNINFTEIRNLYIQYQKYHFDLFVSKRWDCVSEDGNSFFFGLSIKFEKLHDYKMWLLFIKSVHQLQIKKHEKQSIDVP